MFNIHGYEYEDDFDGNQTWVDWTTDHVVNTANQIESITTSAPPTPASGDVVHDAAGNLVFDGRLYYQYDGFNRLVQVNEALAIDPQTDFETGGRLVFDAALGPPLAEFTYDGLGRLIRTVRRDRAPTPNVEAEDYYYDGVRRVAEVVNEGPLGGDARREYVWGPGYVDEAVCQIAAAGPRAGLYWYLQDANYNVLAVLDEDGDVVVQYVHSPYGSPLVRDDVGSGPVNRLGHQGLF